LVTSTQEIPTRKKIFQHGVTNCHRKLFFQSPLSTLNSNAINKRKLLPLTYALAPLIQIKINKMTARRLVAHAVKSAFNPGGGVLLGIFGEGVLPASPNPDPISDQKMPFPTPIFRPGFKIPYPFSDLTLYVIKHNG